ncbi:type III secretion system export apparatus subunit SctR [Candidatus Pantoea multigeneris]
MGVVAVASLIPIIVLTCTCYLKIVIILILTRNAMGVQQVPPNMALYAIGLIATLFIMAPTLEKMYNYTESLTENERITEGEIKLFILPLKSFMQKNTDLDVIAQVMTSAKKIWPVEYTDTMDSDSLIILVPSFMMSELQRAFKVGFLIFLPFLVIDLIVSAVLLALGMQMVSPMTVSLPLKILLFIMVDGWAALLDAIFNSYH